MVEGLDDPYSEYMNNEETEAFQETVTGNFEGIGAEVMQEGNRIIVTSPMRGSPAEEAGIEPGDEIHSAKVSSRKESEQKAAEDAMPVKY